MTSNSGEAVADSTYSTSWLAWKAFSETGDGWGPANNGEHWIRYEFATPFSPVLAIVTGLGNTLATIGTPAYFEGSNDTTTWDILSSTPFKVPGEHVAQLQFLLSEVADHYKYLRIRARFSSSGHGYKVYFFGYE